MLMQPGYVPPAGLVSSANSASENDHEVNVAAHSSPHLLQLVVARKNLQKIFKDIRRLVTSILCKQSKGTDTHLRDPLYRAKKHKKTYDNKKDNKYRGG